VEKPQPAKAIDIAKNKLETFRVLSDAKVPCPDWTTSKSLAEDLVSYGITILARKLLSSSQGKGIVVCKSLPIVDAPLYVKYVRKDKEFRVHVHNGDVIDLQEKRRRNNVRDENGNRPSGLIRNLENDWVFCRNNIVEPEGLRKIAIDAIRAIGLLFGAVDIILSKEGKLLILEVNTAPGLCESTATKYAQAFVSMK
jgi:glutathione synthase/RimK-type ligase-like ATP-grasp enzyme